MKARENDSRSAEYSSETNYDQEQENSEVTNFLISISPVGRIESIGQFGNIDEGGPGAHASRSVQGDCAITLLSNLYDIQASSLSTRGGDSLSRRADERHFEIFQHSVGGLGFELV